MLICVVPEWREQQYIYLLNCIYICLVVFNSVFSAVLMGIGLYLKICIYFGFCCIHLFVKSLNYVIHIKL